MGLCHLVGGSRRQATAGQKSGKAAAEQARFGPGPMSYRSGSNFTAGSRLRSFSIASSLPAMATVIDRVPEEEQRRDLLRFVFKCADAAADAKKIDEEVAPLVSNQQATIARVNKDTTLASLLSAPNEAGRETAPQARSRFRLAPPRRGRERFQYPLHSAAKAAESGV